jgi:hypothetical protein
MKVGDLVRVGRPGRIRGAPGLDDEASRVEIGIIIKIMPPDPTDELDDLFPYLIHFLNGVTDFFGERHLEVISDSR